ncbi:3-phosphoinositide-dependent protein kinase 1-like [Clytia hemisphaerica]|uniref:3-phosphoinositide-dependent protein kinase 1 n=1 Tax=Clytia hemisphaerica TaxID=252671 RepID=A0A7M5WRA0_9CNID
MAAPSQTQPKKKKRDDFHLGKILGEGSYSTVVLAKEHENGKEYAMKVLRKAHIIKEKKVPYVTREKEILAMTNHPFIVKLYFTFQDKENLYYGLSYASRGELLQYIIKLGSFDEECTKHYTAEIICAIEYLHKLGIIHRDLKPENILLSEDMHIKLADFGTAKLIKKAAKESDPPTEQDIRARSFVGTAQYVSPELLTEKTCYKSSDLWALGCILYQLLAGRPPFRAANEYLIFQKITKLEYCYPEGFPETPKDLVNKLIVIDPKERLGCEEIGGYDTLKSHEFFNGIDFEDLPNREPPKLKLYLPSNEPGQPGIYQEVDINTLMDDKDDDFDQWLPGGIVDRSFSDIASKQPSTEELSHRSVSQVEKQKESVWHPFVEGHLIIKMGILDKRKGLFAKRRQFLITEGPEIYYVDPQAMVLKGKIPWTKDLKPEAKNFKIFFIHTPHRTYYLEDPESRAVDWCKAIEEIHNRYFAEGEEDAS